MRTPSSSFLCKIVKGFLLCPAINMASSPPTPHMWAIRRRYIRSLNPFILQVEDAYGRAVDNYEETELRRPLLQRVTIKIARFSHPICPYLASGEGGSCGYTVGGVNIECSMITDTRVLEKKSPRASTSLSVSVPRLRAT